MTDSVTEQKGLMRLPTGTASALLVSISMGLASQGVNPTSYWEVQDPQTVASRYSGEREFDNPYYSVSRTAEEQQMLANIDIAQTFAANLLDNIKDLDADYAKLVNDNFWDLV